MKKLFTIIISLTLLTGCSSQSIINRYNTAFNTIKTGSAALEITQMTHTLSSEKAAIVNNQLKHANDILKDGKAIMITNPTESKIYLQSGEKLIDGAQTTLESTDNTTTSQTNSEVK